MFGKKSTAKVEGDSFTAVLRLPKYIPKEKLMGKVVFDLDLNSMGKSIDWTYTPSGQISLIVSEVSEENPKHGDGILVPFEYIERVGDFILLSRPLSSIIPKEVIAQSHETREESEPEVTKSSSENNGKKRGEKRKLKSINDVDEKIFRDLLSPHL